MLLKTIRTMGMLHIRSSRVTLSPFDSELRHPLWCQSVFCNACLCSATPFGFYLPIKAQITVTWWTAVGQNCLFKYFFSEFSFADCRLPLNITFIAIWKAKWLWCLKYDRYEGLFRKNGNKSLPKAAQRWFRGQWIRTINPVFSCVWRRTPWGAS